MTKWPHFFGILFAHIRTMEQRRYQNIIAFKDQSGAPWAFHSDLLELADISEVAWASLASSEPLAEIQEWAQQHTPLQSLVNASHKVRRLTLNMTQICNLACLYCAAGGDGSYGEKTQKIDIAKTVPQLQFFLSQLAPQESFHITFLGGEPLLYPQGIKQIVDYVNLYTLNRNPVTYSIVTNGTLLTSANVELLSQMKAHVSVSLDGSAEVTDRQRPSKNGLSTTQQILEGLQNLKRLGPDISKLVLHGVFNRDNMELVESYNFFREIQADEYEFTYSVEDSDSESSRQFVEQMNQLAHVAYHSGGEEELLKISFFRQQFSTLDNQTKILNHCGAGKDFLMVDAKNRLYTCPWDVGHRGEQVGEGASVNPQALEAYSASLVEKNNCQKCWARFMCGGGCMYIHKNTTGDKHRKSEVFCDRTRRLMSLALFYYKLCREEQYV